MTDVLTGVTVSVRIPDIAGILQKMSNKNLVSPFFDSCRVYLQASLEQYKSSVGFGADTDVVMM